MIIHYLASTCVVMLYGMIGVYRMGAQRAEGERQGARVKRASGGWT